MGDLIYGQVGSGSTFVLHLPIKVKSKPARPHRREGTLAAPLHFSLRSGSPCAYGELGAGSGEAHLRPALEGLPRFLSRPRCPRSSTSILFPGPLPGHPTASRALAYAGGVARQAREDQPRRTESQAGPADAGTAHGGGDAHGGMLAGPTTRKAEDDSFRAARRAGDGAPGDAE
jgi:hypothetical protein